MQPDFGRQNTNAVGCHSHPQGFAGETMGARQWAEEIRRWLFCPTTGADHSEGVAGIKAFQQEIPTRDDAAQRCELRSWD